MRCAASGTLLLCTTHDKWLSLAGAAAVPADTLQCNSVFHTFVEVLVIIAVVTTAIAAVDDAVAYVAAATGICKLGPLDLFLLLLEGYFAALEGRAGATATA